MSQSEGRKLAVDTPDWDMSELSPADALLLARFDYQELRETLEAIVSGMTATTKEIAQEIESSPAEPTTDS